ncbi:MAG: hypothetical protein R3B11_00890 [Nitrospira sp.]|jgi:hypothetical protein|nr:hypothetical protein [Nitrospira sp.]MDR4474550.1 hypothetical protein [Nitrospira sp.]HAP41814.1 hypothetical protein [Nitrospira sp.]
MKRVVIEELTPGMILAKPVTNSTGLVVLPIGAELDDATLARLQRLGLPSVYVEGEAGDASGKTLDELEAELDHRFRRVIDDPLQYQLREAIRLQLRATHGVSDPPEAPPTT